MNSSESSTLNLLLKKGAYWSIYDTLVYKTHSFTKEYIDEKPFDFTMLCLKLGYISLSDFDDEITEPKWTPKEIEWLKENLGLPYIPKSWEPPKCECGAHKTSNPNCHSEWCPLGKGKIK